MCLNGLSCSRAQNAGKWHSESIKFQIFLGEHAPKPPLVKLVQITHVKSWIHPCQLPHLLRTRREIGGDILGVGTRLE